MDKRIQHQYRDRGGYWIELRAGYAVREGIAVVHTIGESTSKEAHAMMANVVPCACASCRAEIADRTARALQYARDENARDA
jgi:5,10-methenyltetrahydromethanopterin hydrogenase